MHTITSWVRSIVALVMAFSFVEMLVPKSEMKRFVDVVMGLALLAAILAPIAQWGMDGAVLPGLGETMMSETARVSGVLNSSSRLDWNTQTEETVEHGGRATAARAAARCVEARAQAALMEALGEDASGFLVDVEVSSDGDLVRVEVRAAAPLSDGIKERAMQALGTALGVSREKVVLR